MLRPEVLQQIQCARLMLFALAIGLVMLVALEAAYVISLITATPKFKGGGGSLLG